ncbi:hypothetical protein D8674_020734 [Pyrus ussuriensis x Pyrus communis]|uniref:Uncharacterized protein n=1 Tax=Pyrus ussuriensis x Pyrus communis TaxID=2448454 RepID=A0A5N5HGI0_9ROSA|nr:hypothetical protein D8674_020734 [Pyrus ussuriensis x Pyrus communis]
MTEEDHRHDDKHRRRRWCKTQKSTTVGHDFQKKGTAKSWSRLQVRPEFSGLGMTPNGIVFLGSQVERDVLQCTATRDSGLAWCCGSKAAASWVSKEKKKIQLLIFNFFFQF